MATNDKLIQVKHLKKYFNKGALHALDDVSVDVNKGDVMVVIGPSGSGKSTLLRSLNLLEAPTSGAVYFEDVNLADKNVDIDLHRRKMGMVFQHFNLFPHKTVLENITMAPVKLKLKTPAEAKEEAMQLLERIGIADKANEYPCNLSGGQCQRVAIARALCMDPDILCFDEPTSALDPQLTQEVLSVIRQLAGEKRTMVVVTHEMNFARDVADRVIYMENGLVVEDGPAKEVLGINRSAAIRAFAGDADY